jgi:hypothetical protein
MQIFLHELGVPGFKFIVFTCIVIVHRHGKLLRYDVEDAVLGRLPLGEGSWSLVGYVVMRDGGLV